MGCTGSKAAKDAVSTSNGIPENKKNAVVSKTEEVAHPAANKSVPLVVDASPSQENKELADDEDLVPKHHIDQFGNKIDDVTGGRVWSATYYRARKDADFHAKERGRCFEKSKKEFEEDHKKEAKEFSDEGKMHGQKMEEANKRAVEEILKTQNLDDSDKIDLHGLLVAEAVQATRSFVKNAIQKGKREKLEIITGAGHHSDSSKGPVIKPAIIDMCKQENWKLEADEKNEGSFTLFLPSPSTEANQM